MKPTVNRTQSRPCPDITYSFDNFYKNRTNLCNLFMDVVITLVGHFCHWDIIAIKCAKLCLCFRGDQAQSVTRHTSRELEHSSSLCGNRLLLLGQCTVPLCRWSNRQWRHRWSEYCVIIDCTTQSCPPWDDHTYLFMALLNTLPLCCAVVWHPKRIVLCQVGQTQGQEKKRGMPLGRERW